MDTNENNVQGRASYSEEERRELIDEFQSSGLTQAAFCREWTINPKTLARWLRVERKEAEVAFCEMELSEASSRKGNVRVNLPNGIEVIVPIDSPQDLSDVFREAATCLA